MTIAVIGLAWLTAVGGLLLIGRHLLIVRRTRDRAFDGADPVDVAATSDDSHGFLRRWLFRAGYRDPKAVLVFGAATLGAAALGLLLVILGYACGLVQRGVELSGKVPGGLGDLMVPVIFLGPWVLLSLFAGFPTLVVRAARRRRVAQVEHDLPITLELLATLSEAGLGFDAALERVMQAQPLHRPLAQEFRVLQLEIVAGRPRIQCFRRLSWRVDVMALTIFVSALVQTEQVGAGVAEVLRRQADDLRDRRREDALAAAAALPVKLLFPLVICFMPGILVATLGPTFFQIFQFLDNLTRNRTLP